MPVLMETAPLALRFRIKAQKIRRGRCSLCIRDMSKETRKGQLKNTKEMLPVTRPQMHQT